MHRKLFVQVTAPAVLIGLVTVGICVASLWSIRHLQASLHSILAGSVTNLEAAADLEEKLRLLRLHVFLYVMDPTQARFQLLTRDEADIGTALDAVRRTARPEDAGLVDRIAAEYDRYRADRPGPADLASGPWSREAYLAWADAHPVQPVLDLCDELIRRDRRVMDETAAESGRVGDRTRAAMTTLAVIGPLSGLVAGFGIARGLSRSIAQLRVRVEDVRAQLERDVVTVRVESGGGLRGLDAELGEIVGRVREVVEQAQCREREALRAEQLAAVGQLAAGLAHEVRNPLMSMKLLTEAALAGGELTADDLRVIHDQIGRLEQTVTGLLDFARPTPPRRTVADLRAVVAAAADLVRGRADLQNVRIEVSQPPEPVPAAVDVPQVTGVLLNLLLNALDALPGGGRITVAVARLGQEVALTVTDTGPGIAAGVLPRLFEPFVSSKDTGTGLGLNVCRRVARDHGGQIRGENVPGGGARFTITLPGGADAEAVGH
ncbi:MAG TPA: ATP-binding protein [Gemmataceae bacterium]|nr:ATP-binding protein [Gemmataceae bacterium]